MNEYDPIDELLNGYLDETLSERQQTELQRLIDNDPEIAERLRRMQRTCELLSAVPDADPPATLKVDVIAALERQSLLGEDTETIEDIRGGRHLKFRKLATAAAMIALLAALTGVVYRIIGPQSYQQPSIVANWNNVPEQPAQTPVAVATDTPRTPEILNLTLDLQTQNLETVSAFVARSIRENQLLQSSTLAETDTQKTYLLRGSRPAAIQFINDLETIWARLDKTSLKLDAFGQDQPLILEAIRPEQCRRIMDQDSISQSAQIARTFSTLNTVADSLKPLGLNESGDLPLVTIPKPALTSSEPKMDTAEAPMDVMVFLTVQVGR